MSKNVLVISTSLRSNSNSDKLVDEFILGAQDAGNQVEKISLKGKEINFCRGCLACQKTNQCIIKDDAIEIAKKMNESDVIVFATPIYFYEMAGQMKTLLDRMNSLYSSDYKFRDVYFLSTAAEDDEKASKRAINGLEGWIECFEKATLKGTVFAGGVNDTGDINGHKALIEAYQMGKRI